MNYEGKEWEVAEKVWIYWKLLGRCKNKWSLENNEKYENQQERAM
jgi:hypothetical protein